MKLLKDLYQNHSGKVSDKWDIYLKEYEDKLNKYQKLPIKFFKKDEKHSNKSSPIPAEEIQTQIKIKPNKFNIPVIL